MSHKKQSQPSKPKYNLFIEIIFILVVVGLLSLVTYFTINSSNAISRDNLRISDLNKLKNSLMVRSDMTHTFPKGDDSALKSSDLMLSKFPVDPINNDKYKYFYHSDGRKFALYVKMESDNNNAKNDGGKHNQKPLYYEIGSGDNWQQLIPANLP